MLLCLGVGLITVVDEHADPDTDRAFDDAVAATPKRAGFPIPAKLPHTPNSASPIAPPGPARDPLASAYRHAAHEVRASAQRRRAADIGW